MKQTRNLLFSLVILFLAIDLFSAPASSTASATGVRVDTASQLADFNGSGTPDAFEDFNGSGIPDAFEDFNGNGIPDAFEDVNEDGVPFAFIDFNGNGIPDAFEDFNGNGIPDAFEDFNGSYVPDAFESQFADTTGSGIPNFFETVHPSKIQSSTHPDARESYFNATFSATWNASDFPGMENGWLWVASRTIATNVDLLNGNYLPPWVTEVTVPARSFGEHWFHLVPLDEENQPIPNAQSRFKFVVDIEAPVISSSSHPDGRYWYNDRDFICQWTSEDHAQVITGWRWKLTKGAPHEGALTNGNSTLIARSEDSLAFTERTHGSYWLDLAPVDAESAIINERRSTFRFNVNENLPAVTSSSHPNQDLAYPLANVQLNWSVADISTGSFLFYHIVWNDRPTHEPGTDDEMTVTQAKSYLGQSSGSHYFHVRGVDRLGNLTGTGHFRVNINEITGPPAGIEPIQAAFSANVTSGVAPLTVHFTDESTGDITSWAWDFQNNGVVDSTEPAPDAVIYTVPGTYSVRLTVSGPGGSDTETKTGFITVQPPPPVAAFSAETREGFPPLTVTFTDESGGNITTREWDFTGDGEIDATNPDTPVQWTYEQAGEYTVSLTATGPGGSATETKADYITVHPWPLPVAAFSADVTSGYAPLTVTFTDASSGNITTREWDFTGDGTVDATNPAAPVQWTYAEPGTYAVSLTVTGPGGEAVETKSGLITVTARPPAPVAGFSAGVTQGPGPLTVTFTDESTGEIERREWDFTGDGQIDAVDPEGPIQWTYPARGEFTVTLTVTGPGGSDTMVRQRFVEVWNTPPVVGVAAQQIFLSNMAEKATLDASASHDPDGDTLFFSWREFYGNPHHGLIPIGSDSLPQLNLYFPSPGRYEFEVRVSDGELMSAETRTITVYVPGRKGLVGFSPSDAIVRVPDATIRVHATPEDAANNRNPVDVAVSDSLGRYFLENVSPANSTTGRTYYYRVERPGFLSTEELTMFIRPDPGPADNRQDEAINRGFISSISGHVRTPAGAPIEGATVSIAPGLGQPFSTSTDSAGRFQLNDLYKGSWIMQLRATGHQAQVRDVNLTDGMPALEYTLAPTTQTAVLTGKVHLAGTDRPVPNAKVSLGTGAEVHANSQGIYTFNGVPVGDYILTVTQPGFEPLRLPVVSVSGGTKTLDLPVTFASRGPTVFGTVTDATTGRPVRRATIGVETTGGLLTRSDVTDVTGYYMMRDVPTGGQSIRVKAPGYVSRDISLTIASSMEMNVVLERGPNWRPPQVSGAGRPRAEVAESYIFLNNLQQSALLDGRPSSGSNLRYIWRENPDNPVLRLLPAGSQTMSTIQVSGFSRPGIYIFELQVESGGVLGANTTTVTVFAPGLAGNVHGSPSDGVFGLNAATVRAYNNFDDALNWRFNTNMLESTQTRDRPIGNFALEGLSPGSYWVVARAQTGAGYQQYGPVRRQVNFSSAARSSMINMPREEFQLSGTITDGSNGQPLENVRLVVAPGSLSESYRTTTDATGRYRLAAVPRGSGQPVMLMREGYNTRVMFVDIAGNTTANLTMIPSPVSELATLSGYVTADYKGILLPVSYAEVIIGSGLARTFTDGEGFYRIESLPPGDYYGTIRKPGYVPTGLADFGFVTLSPGVNTVDKVLTFNAHGPVVRGTVVNEQQEPIPGVEITLLPPIGPFSLWAASPAAMALAGDDMSPMSDTGPERTDAGGVFQLIDVPHGERQVEIRLPDGRTLIRTLNVEANMEVVWDAPHEAYDLWKVRHFGPAGASNPALSGERADPNNDGVPNLWKYLFGRGPMEPSVLSDDLWIHRGDGAVGFRFHRAEGISDLSYYLEWSSDLVGWTGAAVTPRPVSSSGNGLEIAEVELPETAGPKLFWRLRVSR